MQKPHTPGHPPNRTEKVRLPPEEFKKATEALGIRFIMGVGGFHLFRASDETVSWTANKSVPGSIPTS